MLAHQVFKIVCLFNSTEKKFLAFFFRRVRLNLTDRYREDFPYISPCGVEMNYIHCDDVPIVFTHLLDENGELIQDIRGHAESHDGSLSERLSYGGAGNILTVPFEPEKLCMLPESGRVYHSAADNVGGVGLVKSSLALELSRFFRYEDQANPEVAAPVSFRWKGRDFKLDNSVLSHFRDIDSSLE